MGARTTWAATTLSINDPGTDFRDWLASRASVEPVDIGGAAADIIRDIREHREN